MLLTVAVVGAPHGLRGEVRLDVRTDEPARRLAVGRSLETDPADAGPLTVARTRTHQGVTYVLFAEARDRTAAEALRGIRLVVETDEEEAADEPGADDAWYPHELVGLRAVHADGRDLGEVIEVEHLPAHDVLVVAAPDEGEPTGPEATAEVRVPFVTALVPTVDLEAGTVTLDPPHGLFPGDPADVGDGEDGPDDGGPTARTGERNG